MVYADSSEILVTEKEYQEAFKEGFRKGFKEGFKKGFKEGFEQGFQIGIIKTSQKAVIWVLEGRFEEVPNSIIQVINKIDNEYTLRKLVKIAAKIPNLADFQQVLNEVTSEKSAD